MNIIKRILFYSQEYKNKIFLAMFLIFCSVIVGMFPYIIAYDIILSFTEKNSVTLSYLLLMAGGIILCLLLQSFLYFKGFSAAHKAAYDTLMGMRIKFADKMTKLPLGDINKRGTGSYKKYLVDDIESIEALIAHMLPEGIPYAVAPIIVFIVLFILDWRLALLSMASIPIGMVAMIIMMRISKKRMGPHHTSAEKMNSAIVEYVSGMEVIKIFNRTTHSFNKYMSTVKDYKTSTLNWWKETWIYIAIYGAVLPCTIVLLLPVGTVLYINGTLEFSTFVFSLLLSMSIGVPLTKLYYFFPLFPQVKYKMNKLEEIFEGEELKTNNKDIDLKNYNVEFKKVTFAYDTKDVIKDVSFYAKENSVTAIVGESGSGKSTLAKLLVHFWDVKDGEITIGGININDMSFEKLMNSISYVSQDTFLFNTSIMENIRMGRPNATDEEVIEVSKLAMCHDFIMNMDKGYGTNAGDTGNKLSGGEKQRITIARSILKNAPIIILDEATAFTDPENEDRIQEALNKLIEGKTIIVIAHRLSTIVEADNIILMDKGNLLMQGRHNELLTKSDTYKLLWDSYIKSINWDINVKGVQNV